MPYGCGSSAQCSGDPGHCNRVQRSRFCTLPLSPDRPKAAVKFYAQVRHLAGRRGGSDFYSAGEKRFVCVDISQAVVSHAGTPFAPSSWSSISGDAAQFCAVFAFFCVRKKSFSLRKAAQMLALRWRAAPVSVETRYARLTETGAWSRRRCAR